jgi:serine protease Do
MATTSASLLESLQDAARRTVDNVSPSLVTIGRTGRGAGLVIAPGQVVTCAHNLRDRTTEVTFADGRRAQGTVRGLDADGDLVVLAVDTDTAPPVTWSNTPSAAGDAVFAVGRGQVAFGLVGSADAAFRGPRGRVVDGALQHSAPVARGGSGGPVVNIAGEVVGINTHRLDDGFYLAASVGPDLHSRLARLAGGENIERRRLGVSLAPPAAARRVRQAAGLPDRDGLLVTAVAENSPAAAAGIRRGDLIAAAAAVTVTSTDVLATALDAIEGDMITLTLVRGADDMSVTVSFAADEAPADTTE